ncbi:hypothetical protein [Streptacidiphilus jiangxiensis]|uniref:Secreted protein n=1 Tax=Streptacidiphilus jiangxiensis TaxID=235985 RepID=A0A1H7FFX5_STRJI|nr:hypothetical protein [Streptacidiphilus jiangxiensis]SEK23010.1 hypothetical protein SAMN05414137_101168 [Streptacidiphilus jiangxiensis]
MSPAPLQPSDRVPGPSREPGRPLLLLDVDVDVDVDGPLNPFGGMPDTRPAGFTEHFLMPPTWAALEELRIAAAARPREPAPLLVWVNPDHGRQLMALPFDLVWATTWEAEANDYIAPLIGLPDLPFISWQRPRPVTRGGGCWKTPEVVAWAAGRPFAWVDDEITDTDQDEVARTHPARAMLHRVDARSGLTEDDFAALSAWAAAIA